MSYEFSNADVCIILSPCGLERFNTMVEDLNPGVREEVLDILLDIGEELHRVMWRAGWEFIDAAMKEPKN